MKRILLLLLTALGFTGCDPEEEPQPDMYGTPYAEYAPKNHPPEADGEAQTPAGAAPLTKPGS